jgi:hypothetical protein
LLPSSLLGVHRNSKEPNAKPDTWFGVLQHALANGCGCPVNRKWCVVIDCNWRQSRVADREEVCEATMPSGWERAIWWDMEPHRSVANRAVSRCGHASLFWILSSPEQAIDATVSVMVSGDE